MRERAGLRDISDWKNTETQRPVSAEASRHTPDEVIVTAELEGSGGKLFNGITSGGCSSSGGCSDAGSVPPGVLPVPSHNIITPAGLFITSRLAIRTDLATDKRDEVTWAG